MSQRTNFLTVIIPAYNEEETIKDAIRRCEKFVKDHRDLAEIIVVDDGSVDETGKVCESYAKRSPYVRVIRHSKNLGYGAALRTGFRKARGNVIVVMDADLQSDPEDIPKLLRLIRQGNDVVVGWRRDRKEALYRKIISRAFNLFVDFLFGFKLHDVNGKPKVFRRGVVEPLKIRLSSWAVDVEMLVNVRDRGFKIAEVPVVHHRRGGGRSKLSLRSGIKTIVDILVLKLSGACIE